jgi:hypothetical protein
MHKRVRNIQLELTCCLCVSVGEQDTAAKSALEIWAMQGQAYTFSMLNIMMQDIMGMVINTA